MNQPAQFQRDFQHLYLGISCLFFLSLLYSIFMLSVSMFMMSILALCDISIRPLRIQLRPGFWNKCQEWINKPTWWIISVPFLVVLFGGLYSQDSEFWLSRLRLKVPFLLLPLAWYAMPSITRETYFKMYCLLAGLLFLSSLEVMWDIITNYEQILFRLQRGHVIDTPGNHIRFSLLIAIACISSFILYKRRFYWLDSKERSIYLFLSIYFFAFAHILAVRSGLVALYLSILIFLILSFLVHRRWQIVLFLSMLAATPFLAYQSVPSFKNKVQYMIEDVSRYRLQKWNAYSDSERLLSLHAGLEIASNHLLFGIGPGDLRQAMKEYFETNYDKNTYILPHNQWISILAASGLVGLLLFIVSFFYPILHMGHYREPFFLAINAIIFFSLFAENTFESSMGVAIYIFLLLSGLKYLQSPTAIENVEPVL